MRVVDGRFAESCPRGQARGVRGGKGPRPGLTAPAPGCHENRGHQAGKSCSNADATRSRSVLTFLHSARGAQSSHRRSPSKGVDGRPGFGGIPATSRSRGSPAGGSNRPSTGELRGLGRRLRMAAGAPGAVMLGLDRGIGPALHGAGPEIHLGCFRARALVNGRLTTGAPRLVRSGVHAPAEGLWPTRPGRRSFSVPPAELNSLRFHDWSGLMRLWQPI